MFDQLNIILGIALLGMLNQPVIEAPMIYEPLMYQCDGNYTDKMWQIEITSCSKDFMDLVHKYIVQNDSGKVMRIKYIEATGWETDCNGIFTPFGNTLTVYTCSKQDDYIIGVGNLTHDESIEFTFLHELAHAHIRQNNKEYEADMYAINKMNLSGELNG